MTHHVRIIGAAIVQHSGLNVSTFNEERIKSACVDLANALGEGYVIVSTVPLYNTVVYTLVKKEWGYL